MNEEERLRLNQVCEKFLVEGIGGRGTEDALQRTATLIYSAMAVGREDGLSVALSWCARLEKKPLDCGQRILLDFVQANAVAGTRYGTDWSWNQPTLARETFFLRRAISNPGFKSVRNNMKCMCLNNLGNRLRTAGRIIEALEYWRRALEVNPTFGMALCNRAIGFANYAEALEDSGKAALFLWFAHREATAALDSTAVYTDVRDEITQAIVQELKAWIESRVDVDGISSTDPFAWEDDAASEEEARYRKWCLANCLYLNPSNDLGQLTRACTDSMGLGSHVVAVESPHIFKSFYDQLKQEFVSARWILYGGLVAKVPHFSDKDVIVMATEPLPSLSLSVEKMKAAFRLSYSLFDKISFFINAYMDLGIPQSSVSFRKLWSTSQDGSIREAFDQKSNWGFCALYWLAQDLFEDENDEVAEPDGRELKKMRHCLEHRYLRITTDPAPSVPNGDLALTVSRDLFAVRALRLLKLARSALIYLAIGVWFEERRRTPGRVGTSIEKLPQTPSLPYSEKK